jgi:hypothetical protein
MLYQFSRVEDRSLVKPLDMDALVQVLCGLMDTRGTFYQFSPDFQHQLARLIQRTHFPQQKVVPVNVNKEVCTG